MAETRNKMVIHHASALHKGITNRGANERKSHFLQCVRHFYRLIRCPGYFRSFAPTILQRCVLNKGPKKCAGSIISLNNRALVTIALSLPRWRINPLSSNQPDCSISTTFASDIGSKPRNARRMRSRLFRTVNQLSPACILSSVNRSKSDRGSYVGTPHSAS